MFSPRLTFSCDDPARATTMPTMIRTPSGGLAAALCLLFVWLTDSQALAQQRPLLTEGLTIPWVKARCSSRAASTTRGRSSSLSLVLKGNLLRGPLLGISTGVGPSAELQLDGLSWSRLAIHQRFDAPPAPMLDLIGDSTSSAEDIVVGTKLRFLRETARRPSFGLRFATVPTAGDEKGIGLDTMDFFQSALIGKSIRSTRIVANFGWAILSDPTNGNSQNDVLSYGFSVVHRLGMLAVLADVNGLFEYPTGHATAGDRHARHGDIRVRYPIGQVRLDGGYYIGVTASDERSGVKGGITWLTASWAM